MLPNTKKQHYVWQYYLKAWALENKIWCKRDGKIFNPSTEGVAQERYFYEAIPLYPYEIDLVNALISKLHPTAYETIRSTLQVYIETSLGDENLRRNGLEKYHSLVEEKAVPILSALREGDKNILSIEQNRINFSYFIGCQYTRTKKIRKRDLNPPKNMEVPKPFKECDFNKVSYVMSFLLADIIGNWANSCAVFNLLENNSDLEFLTCDQPVFNFLAKDGEEPHQFKLYYPLSPKFALFISNNEIEKNINSKDKVLIYNNYIKSISSEFLFARNKELLS